MTAKPATCRTCRWLDVPPDKRGRHIARADKGYPCTVVMPRPESILPISVARSIYFRFDGVWPRNYVTPDLSGCPYHEPREMKP